MPYEGGEEAEQAPKKKYSDLDEAIRSLGALTERQRNERIERDAKYPDPEIMHEDTDTVTLRIQGARQPITFSMNFKTNEDHTAFLESEMDRAAFSKHAGSVHRIMPHEEYEAWLAERKAEGESADDEIKPDAAYFEPKDNEDYMKILDQYGVLFSQIDHAHRFAERHLLNGYRERAGKPPLAKEAPTYKYNFPSISPDKPAASNIIEEARKDPAPEESWLDVHRPEF